MFGVELPVIDCLLLSCGVGLLLIVVRFTFRLLLVWFSWVVSGVWVCVWFCFDLVVDFMVMCFGVV